MRRYIRSLCWLLAAWILAGCTDSGSTLAGEDLPLEPGVTVPFQVSPEAYLPGGGDELITYPEESKAGTQHASEVYVLVFEGDGEDATFTGYVKNIGWKEHFGNQLPNKTAEMSYTLKFQFVPGYIYTLLGVGFSEGADQAFEFPAGITRGTALKDVTLTLGAATKVSIIQRSEVYAGISKFEYHNNIKIEILKLRRRVAGVMGYFTNIPHKLTAGGPEVTSLRISLYKNQNVSLPVLRRRQKPSFNDYIESPSGEENASVLVDIALPSTIQKNDILDGGAYVLPMAAPVNKENYTMMVELVNRNQPEPLKRIRVKLGAGDSMDHGQTGGGTGIIDTESAYCFPIVANHFYSIGSAKEPVDIKGNGGDFTIYVDPSWKEDNDLSVGE